MRQFVYFDPNKANERNEKLCESQGTEVEKFSLVCLQPSPNGPGSKSHTADFFHFHPL